jgi:hypothetical protein
MANKKNIQNMTPGELAHTLNQLDNVIEPMLKSTMMKRSRLILRSTKNLNSNVLKLQKHIIHVQIIDLNKLRNKRG